MSSEQIDQGKQARRAFGTVLGTRLEVDSECAVVWMQGPGLKNAVKWLNRGKPEACPVGVTKLSSSSLVFRRNYLESIFRGQYNGETLKP